MGAPSRQRLYHQLLAGYWLATIHRSEYEPRRAHILIDEIRQARQSAGWSQKTLAARAGCSAQAIKRLEGGVGSVDTVVAVMKALDFRLTGLSPGATLHEAMRNRRISRKWSLGNLAAKTGMSRTTIASLERGGGSIAALLKLLAVLAPNAKRRAPERSYWGEGDKQDRDSRFTPADFMEHIYAAFGSIDLDPCAHRLSPVEAKRRIMLEEGGDGLTDTWSGDLVYLNPPYSQLLVWLRRAHEQWQQGNVKTVVCLIPVRTDSAWFHDTLSNDADIFLVQGRVKFLDTNGKGQHTPFSLMVLTLDASQEQKDRLSKAVPGRWLAFGA